MSGTRQDGHGATSASPRLPGRGIWNLRNGWLGRLARAGRIVLACHLAMACPAWSADPVVRWDEGRLTLRAEQTPLADVLDAIARASGTRVHGSVPARDVTADLDDLPLADALGRLLGTDSFALRYGADGRVRRIELLGASDRPVTTPPGVPGEPPADALAERDLEVMARTIRVTGALAQALGTTEPTGQDVVLAALQQPRRQVRAAAQRRVVAAFRADPELADVYLRQLARLDDATAAEALLHWGIEPQELMTVLSTQAPSPALRAKAAGVLQQLQRAKRSSQ